jgi:hypothetical protein
VVSNFLQNPLQEATFTKENHPEYFPDSRRAAGKYIS